MENKKIFMAQPTFSNKEKREIKVGIEKILNSKLSMGENVERLQKEFCNLLKVKYCYAMNACTSALECAVRSISTNPKDEFIIPSQTFIATAMAVHLSGAKPVFAEISKKDLCIDIDDIKRKITKKTKGIILVHFLGLITEQIEEIVELCRKKKIYLIEDCAHGPGSIFKGRQMGKFGDIACFSFYSSKIITGGEGGLIATNNKMIANFAKSFQYRGADIYSRNERYVNPGRNVRMTEINALLIRKQLKNLKKFLKTRRTNAKLYFNALIKLKKINLINVKHLSQSTFWKFPVLLNNSSKRKNILMKLHKIGIMADTTYTPPAHLQPILKKLYKFKKNSLPITENILSRIICLPCHQSLEKKDILYVCQKLTEIID